MHSLELPSIPSISSLVQEQALAHQDRLTKPPRSLGRLEELAVFYAGARGQFPVPTPRRAFLPVFAGDHGVTEEGISAFPATMTVPIMQNVVDGGAAVFALARHFDVSLLAVDVGMWGDLVDSPRAQIPAITRKVRRGTRNLRLESAMTTKEAEQALEVGLEVAHSRASTGVDVVGVGEVGIGNTTASSALIAAHTGCSAESVTGRGTGVDDQGYRRKIAVIEQAFGRLERGAGPWIIAEALGGLEILAMAGFIIGSASHRVPVVLDGLIACAAAVVAHSLCPGVERYCAASHCSTEPGVMVALEHLGLRPLFDLSMRLGEGTGSILGIVLLRSAVAIANEMATFESAGLL